MLERNDTTIYATCQSVVTLTAGRLVGLLAGRRQQRRMSPLRLLMLMLLLQAPWRRAGKPRTRWIDDGLSGCGGDRRKDN